MSSFSSRIAACVLTGGLLAGGVALAQEEGSLLLQTPGAAVTARVTHNAISGPEFQLSHSPEAIRGRAYGEVVSLQVEKDQVGGLMGERPVRLVLKEREGALHVQGMVAGQRANFELGPEKLSGSVGACGYELKVRESRYEGWRSCGGTPEYPVFVEIPAALRSSGTPTLVAALALLLGAG